MHYIFIRGPEKNLSLRGAAQMNYERDNSNITFDSRMGRTKVLTLLLANLTDAQFSDDPRRWFKCLRGLYYICAPYVSSKEAQRVKESIKEVENRLNLGNSLGNSKLVVDSLDKATEITLTAFKDQFLLTNKEDEGEFDPSEAAGLND